MKWPQGLGILRGNSIPGLLCGQGEKVSNPATCEHLQAMEEDYCPPVSPRVEEVLSVIGMWVLKKSAIGMFSAAMIAVAEFFALTPSKWQLPQ